MVLVVLSGVVGRYIYNQIPRSISGRELTLLEIKKEQELGLAALDNLLIGDAKLKTDILNFKNPYGWGLRNYLHEGKYGNQMAKRLKGLELTFQQRGLVLRSAKLNWKMERRIARLASMQKLFKLWHVAHRPFAIIMLIIVVVHVGVSITMGYRWIF
jgi:hypothetical protein